LRILLLYVFLAWVLLGVMTIGLLHVAKAFVRAAHFRESVVEAPSVTPNAAIGSSLPAGLGPAQQVSAPRSSEWPAPAAYWSH
jgi:hypothetical protein